MNSNRMLTLALYLLLGGLVAVFGYRACQLKKEQAAKLAEQAEMEQTLRDMGYQSTEADQSGVAKPSDLTDTKTTAPAPTSSTTEPATTTTPAKTADTKVAETKTANAPAPVAHSTESKPTTDKKFVDRQDDAIATEAKPQAKLSKPATKGLVAKGVSNKTAAPSKPAFAVIAASFSKKENARKVMEALVKKGFTNAEVSAKGKFWVVISDRAATKEAAAKLVDQVNKQPDCAKAYVYKRP